MIYILWNFLRLRYGLRFKNREHLLHWQDAQVRRFLRRILSQSTFYQQRLTGLPIEHWQDFPTIDKQIMMDHFDSLNTVGIYKADAMKIALAAEQNRDFSPTLNGVTIGLSSGTSGNRGIFLVSRRERLLWVGAVMAKILPANGMFQRHRIAFFLRANSNLYETVRSIRFKFKFFDLLTPPAEQIARLNALQPTILVAPPSMLRFLAEYQQRGELNIQPQKVISVAETLDPLDESVIARAFDQIVHQAYQATEGFLATTCDYGTLHLHEDMLVIQRDYLDREAGKFMPIITDFNRTSQPIIRYRLNDILTEKHNPCPCGSTMFAIEHIEGRSDDIFQFEGGEILFPDYMRRTIITTSDRIRAYTVRQIAPDQIIVALDIADEERDRAEHLLRAAFTNLFEESGILPETITLSFEELAALSPSITKLKRISREF